MIRVRMHRFSDKLLNATRRAVMMCALVLGCPDGSPTGQLRSRPSIYIRQRNPIHPYLFLYTAVLGALKRRRTMATQPSFSSTLGLITSRLILLRSARRTVTLASWQTKCDGELPGRTRMLRVSAATPIDFTSAAIRRVVTFAASRW